jgi:hypothetical protein
VFLSIWWWRTVHPRILGKGGFAMDSTMVWVLMVCLAAFTLLFVFLLRLRVGLEGMKERVDSLSRSDECGGDE